jgi:two-component system response regulator HydG
LRELNNVIRRSVLLSEGDTIELESLPMEMVQSQGSHQMNESSHGQVGLLKSIAWTAERQAIVDTLERVNNNKSRASELLTIDRKTLYNKLKLYNIKA